MSNETANNAVKSVKLAAAILGAAASTVGTESMQKCGAIRLKQQVGGGLQMDETR
jgi:hypothetical protein